MEGWQSAGGMIDGVVYNMNTMNSQKIKLFTLFVVGALAGMLGMYLFNNYKIEKKEPAPVNQSASPSVNSQNATYSAPSNSRWEIDALTDEETVVSYVKQNRKLPDYYLTKSEAREKGWVASKGNLCDVLPGKAIGGDKFSNREKLLPQGNQYFEADVNYNCGNRGADRIVFTKKGEVWLTHNHYKSFEKQ